jgi:predicted dehydrogenase
VDQYRLEAEEFSAALREHRAPQIAATDAVANLRAMDALRASARAGGLRVTV